MRYADLQVLSSTPEEAETSVVDLVSVASGNNRPEISMDEILSVMHQQGWEMTRGMIMDILKDNEMVERITKDKIILKNDNQVNPAQVVSKEAERNEKHVDKLAKTALNNIKK